ncbi:N-ethylmaleimide reductase [Paraperlucidibaca baekdonensis]|uniref:N-ethylmaleimide reductase n=1 Tax=Paraperlucidibaca baekdonensis TaxID=748120 RepID=A0A3E0H2H1_9GAMM|nr:N-ethylmaleimide reductase [Paraperlucidibaca baekdonensis]REH36699.1 N-ethylmaleimide reductase [Paraperlucidibaca baekdonensis]
MSALFEPLTMGALTLPNRVIMAPLTRMRASAGDVPSELSITYYAQRASAGLIITEASQVSPQGKGYMQTPGIYSPEQVAGWQRVTAAVHEAGGRIAMQLWHVGRISHSSLQVDNQPPVSASDLPAMTKTTVLGADGNPERVPCSTPRALALAEIPELLASYTHATHASREAGFDYVEVHAAHGYLLHQFQSIESNKRDDAYGGSLENRARLTLEVLDATIAAWDADRVGVRISPMGNFNALDDAEGEAMGLYLAEQFAQRGIAYLHLSEPDWAGGPQLNERFRIALRARFPGVIIGAGNYTKAKAEPLLAKSLIDAAAFGRPYIANPDLAERLRDDAPLNEQRPALFYGGGAEGYTDYPALSA